MLGEIFTAASILAVAQSADRLGGRRHRLGMLSLIRKGRSLDWYEFVSDYAWRAYTAVYGGRSSSRIFWIRSATIYLSLVALSLSFLWMYFPTTFLTTWSTLSYGNSYEIIGWVISIALGCVLYTAANAQTLYFLEILRTAPTGFKFILVAYADLLITASIALFGVPALFYISSIIAFSGTVQRVGLEFDFGQPVRSPTADLLYAIEGHVKDRAYKDILEMDGRFFYFEAKFTVKPGDPDFSERDFDLSKELIEKGEVPDTEFNAKLGVIRVLDSTGSVVGFRERDVAYNGSLSTMEVFGDGEDFGKKKAAFCKNVSTGIPPKVPYMSYNFNNDQKKSVFESCLAGGKIDIDLPVRLNASNISHYGVYRFFLTQNLVDLMGAVPSGFQRYLSISPYIVLFPPSERGAWNHFHVSGEKDERYQIALDAALLEAFNAEVGGYNYALMKSIPGGTINFAIMSTALFNLVVMVILGLIYPWSMAVRKSATLSKYVRLREYPFTFIGIGFVGYVAFWRILSL